MCLEKSLLLLTNQSLNQVICMLCIDVIMKDDLIVDAHLRHSIIREAMPLLLIMLKTQMRLIPHTAGSGTVEQHQALCRSNITFSLSETSGNASSITL